VSRHRRTCVDAENFHPRRAARRGNAQLSFTPIRATAHDRRDFPHATKIAGSRRKRASRIP